jgi:hypothetical protein
MIIVKRWKAAEIGLTNINFFYGFSIYTIIMEKAKAVSAVEINFPKAEIGERYELNKIIGKGSYGFVADAKIKGTEIKVKTMHNGRWL